MPLAVIGPRLLIPSHNCVDAHLIFGKWHQLRAVRLGVPGPGTKVPVQGAGGVVADLDGAGLAAVPPRTVKQAGEHHPVLADHDAGRSGLAGS